MRSLNEATTLGDQLNESVGEVTVVFGNGVPALTGRIVGRRKDHFVLQTSEQTSKLHLVRWNAVAYIRAEREAT